MMSLPSNSGDPTPPGSLLPSWSPVSEERHEYLKIDKDSEMTVSQDYLERVTFWKNIMSERPLP